VVRVYPLIDECPRCGGKSLLYFPSAAGYVLCRVLCTPCGWTVMVERDLRLPTKEG